MLAGQVEIEQWEIKVNTSILEPQAKFTAQMAKCRTFLLSSYDIVMELGMYLDTVHSSIRYFAMPMATCLCDCFLC